MGENRGPALTPTSDRRKRKTIPRGTATIPNEIFNLVKCIVGAGVLSLSAGVAEFGNGAIRLDPCWFDALPLMGSISAYTFPVLARV
jgi:hypothetical protein